MKTYIYLLSCSLFFAITACRDNKPKPQPVIPVAQLPPYTETGANTFGCLIDGEVFVPGKNIGSLSISLQCYYQFNIDKYVFGLKAGDYVNEKGYRLFFVGSDSINYINEPVSIPLVLSSNNSTNSIVKGGGFNQNGKEGYYTTNDSVSGILKINKMDFNNQIISGTFAFDAIDTVTNKVIHVTDGRFDVRFTR